jgi:hypothetical protein
VVKQASCLGTEVGKTLTGLSHTDKIAYVVRCLDDISGSFLDDVSNTADGSGSGGGCCSEGIGFLTSNFFFCSNQIWSFQECLAFSKALDAAFAKLDAAPGSLTTAAVQEARDKLGVAASEAWQKTADDKIADDKANANKRKLRETGFQTSSLSFDGLEKVAFENLKAHRKMVADAISAQFERMPLEDLLELPPLKAAIEQVPSYNTMYEPYTYLTY